MVHHGFGYQVKEDGQNHNNMRKAKAFSTVNWRKYLDIKTNPRAKSFLESRGDEVLWQIAGTVHKAAKGEVPEVVLLIHPNAGAVIRIPKDEYDEMLELCLNWFVHREDYEKCTDIQWFQSDLEALRRGIKPSKKYREKVI